MMIPFAVRAFSKQMLVRMTAAAVLVCSGAQAAPINLVSNGGLEVNAGSGQVGANTSIAGWSSSGGYNFLFAQGSADTIGAMGTWFAGPLQLWGASNGGATALAVSNNAGFFYGADGAYGITPLEQSIGGLTAGRQYQLSFEWAAAQQYGFYGATTSAWIVSFGSQIQATGIHDNPSNAASGWMNETMTFTANSGSALLSFLSRGTPVGQPPFSLLDGISLIELPEAAPVPEPASWLLLGAAAIAAMLGARRRRPGARAS